MTNEMNGDDEGQKQDEGGDGGDGGAGPAPGPGPVPYNRFQSVILERDEARKALEAERAERAREAAAAAESAERVRAAEAARDEALGRLMRLEVATAKGLPVDLAERLRGSSREELEADADTLAGWVKARTGAPGVPPPTRGGAGGLDVARMTPAEIRKHRAELLRRP